MPQTAQPTSDEVISLEEFVEFVETHVDMKDCDSIMAAAGKLKALQNNRTFVADMIVSELKDIYHVQADNSYSGQVFLLHRGKDYFMRANFWPSERDQILKSSGHETFFYYVPHDHNFDFLTIGYHGPGYISDFYEYDHQAVAGYPGEEVELKFVGSEILSEGKVILYREALDIHMQLPPEAFSVSLNLNMDKAEQGMKVNQYFFDLEKKTIGGLANRMSMPLVLSLAGHLATEETRDVLSEFSKIHPCPRTRYAAFKSLARLTPADEQEIWSRAAKDASRFVSAQADRKLREGDAMSAVAAVS